MAEENTSMTLIKKALGLMSKKRREEEKERVDLWTAIREPCAQNQAAVMTYRRPQFRGQLLDHVGVDAERMLQSLLSREEETGQKRTLRERLMMADVPEQNVQVGMGPMADIIDRNNQVGRLPTASFFVSEIAPRNSIPNSPGPSTLRSYFSLVDSPPIPMNEEPISGTSQVPVGMATGSSEAGINSTQDVQGSIIQETSVAIRGKTLLRTLLYEDQNNETSTAQEQGLYGEIIDNNPGTSSLENHEAGLVDNDSSIHVSDSGASMETGYNPRLTSDTVGTPIRVSLLALLREQDDGNGVIVMGRHRVTSSAPMNCEIEDLEEETRVDDPDSTCCVCMMNQKGAAFIPCGHTFCRNCVRELRKARGMCPLCNKEIKDILNLY